MENLGRSQMIIGRNGAHIVVMAQVTMTVAEGITNLSNDQNQHFIRISAEPKADWIEHMAQNARLREQKHLSRAIKTV